MRVIGTRWVTIAVLGLSCTHGNARFEARYVSDFAGGPITVSVLGVYRDGRLRDDASARLVSEMSRVLEPSVCTGSYGRELQRLNVDAWSALYDQMEGELIGDAFLSAIAPAAQGDYILVVGVFGRVPMSRDVDRRGHRVLVAHNAEAIQSDARRIIGMPKPPPDLEVSARLFSVGLRRTAALLNLSYVGSSVDDALGQFAENLEETLPGTTCSGWKWGSVSVIRERDMAGFSLKRFHLVPATAD